MMTALEAFADSFERLASSREQEELAEGFRQFVTGLPGLVMAAASQEMQQRVGEALFAPEHRIKR